MNVKVIFDSEEKSLREIEDMIKALERKYNSDLVSFEKKVRQNQELETDEVIDDLMLWRSLEMAKREAKKVLLKALPTIDKMLQTQDLIRGRR